MTEFNLIVTEPAFEDLRRLRQGLHEARIENPKQDGYRNSNALLVEIRRDVEDGVEQFEAIQIKLAGDGLNWEDCGTVLISNPSGIGFPASAERPERRTVWYFGRMGYCLDYAPDDIYIELLEDLDEPKDGTEADPPMAEAAVMEFDDKGELVIGKGRLFVKNRGRGMFYEQGTRGYPKSLLGERHFFPIECDPGGSSSSSSSSSSSIIPEPLP